MMSDCDIEQTDVHAYTHRMTLRSLLRGEGTLRCVGQQRAGTSGARSIIVPHSNIACELFCVSHRCDGTCVPPLETPTAAVSVFWTTLCANERAMSARHHQIFTQRSFTNLFRCSSSGYATAWPHNSANAKDSSPTYSIPFICCSPAPPSSTSMTKASTARSLCLHSYSVDSEQSWAADGGGEQVQKG